MLQRALGLLSLAIAALAAPPGAAQSGPAFPGRSTPANSPSALVLGDLDGDALSDAAAITSQSSVVSVFLDGPAGEFLPAGSVTFSAGAHVYALALADVSHDGRSDLVAAVVLGSGGGPRVLVHLGDGLGGFGAASPFACDPQPWSLRVADLDGDGLEDVAVGHWIVPGATAQRVTLLYGTGGGGLGPPAYLTTGPAPASASTVDLNEDGRLDLAIGESGAVRTALGIPTGFAPSVAHATSHAMLQVEAGDWDGDGHADLLALGVHGRIYVYRGDGGGDVLRIASLAVPETSTSFCIGDADADGDLDAAVHAPGASIGGSPDPGDSAVLENLGGEGFVLKHLQLGRLPVAGAFADVDGDGRVDLVTANGPVAVLEVYAGLGAGGLASFERHSVGAGARDVALLDVDADGATDVALANSNGTVTLLRGASAGGLLAGSTFPVLGANASLAALFANGDVRPDLAVAAESSDLVSILLGHGDGGFSWSAFVTTGAQPILVRAGDLEPDGDDDLVIGCAGAKQLEVRRNTGTAFAPALALPLAYRPAALALADLDADAEIDLAVACGEGIAPGTAVGEARLYLGDGSGGFAAPLAFGGGFDGVGAGDLTGDGLVDVLFSPWLATSTSLTLLRNGGGGTFTPQLVPGVLEPSGLIALADADADGDLDAMLSRGAHLAATTFSLRLLRNDGSGSFLEEPYSSPRHDLAAAGDLDHDGRVDLLLVDSALAALHVARDTNSTAAPCGGAILHYGHGCPIAGAAQVPSLTASGCAAALGALELRVECDLPSALALLLVGSGSGSAPLGGGCELFLSPLLPLGIALPLAATGSENAIGIIAATIPAMAAGSTISAQAFFATSFPPGHGSTAGVLVTFD